MATTEPIAELASEPATSRSADVAPGVVIDVRAVAAAGGVIVTVAGSLGRSDAAVLSRRLHAELDNGPTVMVLSAPHLSSCHRAGRDVLAEVRERARAEEVGLHVVDPENVIAGEEVVVDEDRRVLAEAAERARRSKAGPR